jgi:hypothetical protein
VFEQLDDPKLAGRKTWKERLGEGLVILVVSAAGDWNFDLRPNRGRVGPLT